MDCKFVIRFGLPFSLLEIKKLEKPLNIVTGQLCGPIVAVRHNVCPSSYAQKIPANILNILGTKNFQNFASSYRGSTLKKRPKKDYLGSP